MFGAEAVLEKVGAALRGRLPILGIVLVAFLLRLGWLLHAQPEPVSDFWVYQQSAVNLLDRGFLGVDGPSALYLPGHAWLLAGLMVVSRSVTWLSLCMVVLSTLACFLVYRLAQRLTGREVVALVAAAACAVSPTFVIYGPVLATEHLFVVLMLIALLVALRIESGNRLRVLATGLLLGLAALTRGEAVFYVPVLLGWLWFGDPHRPRRVRLRLALLFAAGVVAVVTPWIVRNAVVMQPGVMLSSAGGINFYFGHNPNHYGWSADVPWPAGDELAANRMGWELGLEYVRDNPVSVLASTRDGTYQLFAAPQYPIIWTTQQPIPGSQDFEPRSVRFEEVIAKVLPAASALYLTLSAASLLLWRRWSPEMRLLVAGLVVFNWLGNAVLFMGDARFRYFLDVVFTVLVALTLVTLWQAGRRRDPGLPSPGTS